MNVIKHQNSTVYECLLTCLSGSLGSSFSEINITIKTFQKSVRGNHFYFLGSRYLFILELMIPVHTTVSAEDILKDSHPMDVSVTQYIKSVIEIDCSFH